MKKKYWGMFLTACLVVGTSCEKGSTEADKRLQEQVKQLEAELLRARSEMAQLGIQNKTVQEEMAKSKRKWEEAENARKVCESKCKPAEVEETPGSDKATSVSPIP